MNLINNLPPNSLFNEALTGDRETMMALHRAKEIGQSDEDALNAKPVGPRVSQVSEEARRLGEVVALLKWLGGVVLHASPKFRGGKLPNVEPYTKPVMIDGSTGEWNGKASTETLQARHKRRVALVQAAAARNKT